MELQDTYYNRSEYVETVRNVHKLCIIDKHTTCHVFNQTLVKFLTGFYNFYRLRAIK